MKRSLAALSLAGLAFAGAGCSTRDISRADINGDEQPDRVYISSTFGSGEYRIYSQLNRGGGRLGQEATIAVLEKMPLNVYLKDGAGNGRPDLFYVLDVGADGASEYHLYIMKAKGDGTFIGQKFVKKAAKLPDLFSG